MRASSTGAGVGSGAGLARRDGRKDSRLKTVKKEGIVKVALE